MKNLKKIMALVLVGVMIMLMGTVAMADNDPVDPLDDPEVTETVTITVKRDSTYAGDASADSRVFTWYKVFSANYGDDFTGSTGGGYDADGTPGTVTGDTTNPVSYTASQTIAAKLGTINGETHAWTTNSGNKWFDLTYIPGTGNYSVSWRTGVTNDADAVQEAAKWLLDNGVYETTTGTLEFSGSGDTAQWSAEVDKGYYILSSEAGNNLIAATTDIVVNEKNDYPPLDKTQADEDQQTKDDNTRDVAVGDVLSYDVKVTIPATAAVGDKILVYDTNSQGLKFNDDLTITNTAGATVGESDYTGTGAVTGAAWQRLITVTDGSQGKDVVFSFTMTVNESAIVDTGKENESALKYGPGSGETPWPYESTPDKVEYKTYFAGIEKTDGTDTEIKLEGVKFTLTENGTAFNVKKSGEYYIPGGTSNEVVTDKSGLIKIRGLDEDKTYVLTETENPNPGYNMLAEPVTLTLHLDSVTTVSYTPATTYDAEASYFVKNGEEYVSITFADEDEFTAYEGTIYTSTSATSTYEDAEDAGDKWGPVVNNKGTVLPSTGGVGTTIFYVLGTVLVLGAAIMLVAKKRVNAK